MSHVTHVIFAQTIFIQKVCGWALVANVFFPHKGIADGFVAWQVS